MAALLLALLPLAESMYPFATLANSRLEYREVSAAVDSCQDCDLWVGEIASRQTNWLYSGGTTLACSCATESLLWYTQGTMTLIRVISCCQ